MSDIRTPVQERLEAAAGYSRQRGWRSLRLLVVPDVAEHLIVSLVVIPKDGHPHLHHLLRQRIAPWDPAMHEGDDTLYALSQALAIVNQTRG
jgi:hypothetical protein